MKKVFMAILFSLSVAYLTGCTNTQTIVSSVSESSTVVSSEVQTSKDETSADEKSVDEKSVDEKSVDEKSVDEKSVDEKSVNEKSVDEKSVNEKSVDEKSVDEKSVDEISEQESSEDESIFSFKININGIVYKLPFDCQELKDNAYHLTKSGKLEPYLYSRSVEWKNDNGNTVITQFWNPSDEKQDYDDCKVGSVEIKLGEGLSVVLPGDFTFDLDVTPDKIKEQYGEPESEHIYNDYVTLRYKVDLSKSVEFFIYTKEEYAKFSSVTVKNFS